MGNRTAVKSYVYVLIYLPLPYCTLSFNANHGSRKYTDDKEKARNLLLQKEARSRVIVIALVIAGTQAASRKSSHQRPQARARIAALAVINGMRVRDESPHLSLRTKLVEASEPSPFH